jgi:hypothetical protein
VDVERQHLLDLLGCKGFYAGELVGSEGMGEVEQDHFDFRSPILDFRFEILDFRFEIGDLRFEI